MLKKITLILLIGWSVSAFSQEKKKENKGHLSGQWRTYYLSTFNKGELKDFYALATGGKIKYTQAIGKYFTIGGAVYTSINTEIQDLTVPDGVTGRVSRYEAGLFDVDDLSDRLVIFTGELYVQFTSNAHEFTLGRIKIISPLINPEDGRMIPTLEQGLWYKYQKTKWGTQIGLFNEIAPRSTGGFFGIGESIGKYPVGRSLTGQGSLYANNTQSDWIGVFNLDWKPTDSWKVEFWDYIVDNTFHTAFIRPSYHITNNTVISAEWLHQDKLGDGGNKIDSLRYFEKESSNIVGVEISQKTASGKISIGYDHILKGGRFLFPREWGREFLFSFQKRERSEGTANNHALVAYYEHSLKGENNTWKGILSVGHHWKPQVTNAEDNKYAQPDYTHFNLDLFWIPKKIKGLRPELLLTYKKGSGDYTNNPNFILNKVDMYQINFVINYNF